MVFWLQWRYRDFNCYQRRKSWTRKNRNLWSFGVFDSLNKAGIEIYYFAKKSGLEIDFVICYNNSSCLVEAKAKSGNTKSSKTVHAHPEHYGKVKIIYGKTFENFLLRMIIGKINHRSVAKNQMEEFDGICLKIWIKMFDV